MRYAVIFLLLHPALLVIFVLWAKTSSKYIAAPALVIDVLLNFTTASIIWGWPRKGEWTISKRLKRQQMELNKRGRWALRLAHILNDIKPGHI